jgi:hypothetical protein
MVGTLAFGIGGAAIELRGPERFRAVGGGATTDGLTFAAGLRTPYLDWSFVSSLVRGVLDVSGIVDTVRADVGALAPKVGARMVDARSLGVDAVFLGDVTGAFSGDVVFLGEAGFEAETFGLQCPSRQRTPRSLARFFSGVGGKTEAIAAGSSSTKLVRAPTRPGKWRWMGLAASALEAAYRSRSTLRRGDNSTGEDGVEKGEAELEGSYGASMLYSSNDLSRYRHKR